MSLVKKAVGTVLDGAFRGSGWVALSMSHGAAIKAEIAGATRVAPSEALGRGEWDGVRWLGAEQRYVEPWWASEWRGEAQGGSRAMQKKARSKWAAGP